MNATVKVMTVTPQLATEWLAHRWGEQRSVRVAHIRRIVADMVAGRFKISPDAILRIRGELANGQHRLTAVVQSGIPQTFIVMESEDADLYKVIDAGLRRTASDSLIGLPYSKSLPSIARLVQAYDARSIRASARTPAEALTSGSRDTAPSQTQVIDYCLDNQSTLIDAAAFVNPLYEQTKLVPVSIAGALYAVVSLNMPDALPKVRRFLEQVYVEGGSPAAEVLRNRLIANLNSKARLAPGYIFAITVKAFRCFRLGSKPGSLRWANGEEFPML